MEVLCYFLGIPKFHHMRGEEGEVFALVVDVILCMPSFLFLSMAYTDREESNFCVFYNMFVLQQYNQMES